jgi:hypothetical protein
MIAPRSANLSASSLTITDSVEFSEPTEFESALITPGEVSASGTTLNFSNGNSAITVDFSDSTSPLVISRDTIDQLPHPTRVALAPKEKVSAITMRLVIRPV